MQPITLEFGERILSDALVIEPTGLPFKMPAILSIFHSISQWPELSSIIIKGYDIEKKDWVILPYAKGESCY